MSERDGTPERMGKTSENSTEHRKTQQTRAQFAGCLRVIWEGGGGETKVLGKEEAKKQASLLNKFVTHALEG